ncbi:hypothetical protein PR202_ga06479 [Eleusine coracana subsp. coracana]|uniref:RING-type E3 ubiquitin transferase n=1 Tax=Eleusine coracana subsp. coracana TaxID=191504 RepID=A0AAV5BW21_ELECO|nr:hypothetical protein PR202_ga06479 [Eleusine coracana subsp. coracana]
MEDMPMPSFFSSAAAAAASRRCRRRSRSPTQPLVSPARKKDDRKDAAVMLAAPLQSGERGEGKAAVAVDGDRGSQYALKWAADHILSRTRSFFLLHVRRKHTSLHGHDALLFAKGCESLVALQCRETILDGADVSKAIVDFVASNNIDKLVLGAASRNAFTRTIKKLDTPTSVTKLAPNFCSVYVIAKGKLSSFRPATDANVNDTTREDLKSDLPGNRVLVVKSEPTPKLHNGDNPSMLMPVHGAVSVGASFDESTDDGSLTSASSYLKTGSSWPSEFSDTDQHSGYFSPEYLEYNRDRLLLPNKGNDQALIAPNGKYLGFDESSFNDSALSPGYNICDQEDDEAELTLFKIEQNQNNSGMLSSGYREEHKEKERSPETYSSNLPPYKRPDAEPCSRETIIEEFTDHSSQDTVHPILRRLPPKFYSPRNDCRRESAPEENYRLDLKSKALPRPIETKKILESLPTRLECRTYTPQDIADATERFAQELKIGEGGYGPVYKATLDNTTVAIKILHSNITQGLKQFRQEVDLLNNIRHPNMVHLVGACPEYGCLVYEYMPNGSLEDRLFCQSGTPPLPWRLRFKMAVEIANGLLYLHKLKPEAFVHRDLKPGNILLDADFVTKIGDVGLARIIPLSVDDAAVTQYRETAAAGTFCYIDPEYQKTGLVCTKSDVYALGVIYLQMITGKDAMGLAYTVSDALEEGTFAELLDRNVTGWPEKEARELAELALKCCEMRRKDRPDLESVVLPELIRLYKLVTSSSGDSSPPSMDHHQRSASEKDLPLDDDLVDILNDRIAKGASFAV